MKIGWVADPLNCDRWPEMEALLEPARAVSDEAIELFDTNYLLWAVMDGNDLLACATARLTEANDCEVILVGGRDHRRWLGELDEKIGAAAAEAGATRMVAAGRAGWTKSLKALGWASDRAGRLTTYSRSLEV